MAVLSDDTRAAISADFQRARSNEREVLPGVTKADLRAAVNALDSYLDTNAAALNSAIPQPVRGALTTKQKLRLAAAVLIKRMEAL